MIASAPGSDQNLLLGRTRWLKEASAKNVGADFEQVKKWAPLDLQIFEYDGKPDTSSSPPCERQGRCFLGCLPGARHTLNKTLMNYVLTDPRVQLRALAEVDTMEPAPGGGYLIHYENHRVGDHDPDRKKQVKAPVVVLAAGVLGTTKLLLRSRDTMTFSDELGRHFSTNGDAAGFIRYSAPYTYPLWATRGPINTSHVMYRVKNTGTFINVEDAGVPSMFAETVKRALEAFGNGVSHSPLLSALDLVWNVVKDGNPLEDLFNVPDARKAGDAQTEDEMLQHVFFFNLMGRDRSRGRFELNDKRELKLGFEGGPLSDDPVYRKMDELMKAMADAMNTGQSTGNYVRFPFWGRGAKLLDNEFHAERRAITVHPLGGCRMGNTSSEGVVDVKGRVFNTAAGGDSVHGGLYIADGSVMPGPLAVNPTLTIVAMAQKIAVNIQQAAAAGG